MQLTHGREKIWKYKKDAQNAKKNSFANLIEIGNFVLKNAKTLKEIRKRQN
jgi:hypothetical protein